jgi:hypothetical protein
VDASHLGIVVEVDDITRTGIEQLCQRVLQQRQRRGLVGYLRDHLADEVGIETDPYLFGRTDNGLLEFCRG